jgi:hypothetical protein
MCMPHTHTNCQAIDDRHVESAGAYMRYTLLPWGPVYKVVTRLTTAQTEPFHGAILQQLQRMQACSKPVLSLQSDLPKSDTPVSVTRRGSWEHAAACVYWDAHYQVSSEHSSSNNSALSDGRSSISISSSKRPSTLVPLAAVAVLLLSVQLCRQLCL